MSAYFDAFATAVRDYPSTDMTLRIIDVTVLDPPYTAPEINEDEVASFKVRVNNNGHLKISNLKLHIEALNGAQVGETDTGPWLDEIFPDNLALEDHDSLNTTEFYLKAPS